MDKISDSMLAQELRKMEEELLSRQVRTSSDRLDVILAEAFIEFGSSGEIYDKQAIIAALADTVVASTVATNIPNSFVFRYFMIRS